MKTSFKNILGFIFLGLYYEYIFIALLFRLKEREDRITYKQKGSEYN